MVAMNHSRGGGVLSLNGRMHALVGSLQGSVSGDDVRDLEVEPLSVEP